MDLSLLGLGDNLCVEQGGITLCYEPCDGDKCNDRVNIVGNSIGNAIGDAIGNAVDTANNIVNEMLNSSNIASFSLMTFLYLFA